ncbi:hypothetical protein [Nocardia wallacei]|uniref:hypothetical protein n=1 Tax=Nocardia wallacei TaxID=480035 RepID=UPI00245733A2|nr:hypothetical protein [Nocardia wallacei]
MSAPVPDPAGDLNPATTEEFLALMRHAQHASGRSPGQLANYAGKALPRSTAYRFVNRKNRSLPRRADRVEAFFKGCKYTEDQIVTVMQAWRRLSGTAPAAPRSKPPAPPPRMPVDDLVEPLLPDPPQHVITGTPVHLGGDIREVTIRYRLPRTEAQAPTTRTRSYRYLAVLISMVSAIAAIALMLTSVAANPAAGGIFGGTSVQTAVVVLLATLGVAAAWRGADHPRLRRPGSRARLMMLISAGTSGFAALAVAPHAAEPLTTAPLIAAVVLAVTGWLTVSMDPRGARLLAHLPVLLLFCVVLGAAAAVGTVLAPFPPLVAVATGTLTTLVTINVLACGISPLARTAPRSGERDCDRNDPVTVTRTNGTAAVDPPLLSAPDTSPPSPAAPRQPTPLGEVRSHPQTRRRRLRELWKRIRVVRADRRGGVGSPATTSKPSTARDLIDAATPMPPLPSRTPRSVTLKELLGLTSTVPAFDPEPEAAQQMSVYEIAERIRCEREQLAAALTQPPLTPLGNRHQVRRRRYLSTKASPRARPSAPTRAESRSWRMPGGCASAPPWLTSALHEEQQQQEGTLDVPLPGGRYVPR